MPGVKLVNDSKPSNETCRDFERSFAALAQIFEFTAAFFGREGISAQDRMAVDFAVEEIFTNVVKYQSASGEDVTIMLERNGGEVRVTIVDRGSERFDPTTAPDVRTDGPLEARRPGGLGIHLTRRLVDQMEYEYAGRTGTITLTKRLSLTP